MRLWQDVGAPYEAAIARSGLAEAHRANGHTATADLEQRAARAALERIGAAAFTKTIKGISSGVGRAAATLARIREHPVVIVAQDTSEADLTCPHEQMKGSGPLNDVSTSSSGKVTCTVVMFMSLGCP